MTDSPTLHLFTLGGLRVAIDGRPFDRFNTRKVAALLVYVAVTGRPHQRETLAELLWPDRTPSAARSNLRVALSDLRKHADAWVAITRQRVGLKPEAAVHLDCARLAGALSADPFDAGAAAEALALYQGDFLAGFHLEDAYGFEAWVTVERERLHQLALGGFRRLADDHLQRGEFADAVAVAREGVRLDPLAEPLQRQLMRALAANGQPADALAQFERCRRLLADELGLEPAAETIALADAIRAGETVVDAPTPALPARPPARPGANLPADATPFFGRSDELETLQRLFDEPTTRLITLAGAGGMGKTRLALAAARRLAAGVRFDGGVHFVPLSAVEDAAQMVTATADAIGLELSAGADPEQQLSAALRARSICLVLDNVEQIAGAAALIARLLRESSRLVLLVTSRARLELRAEHVLELRGLPFAGSDGAQTPAAALFTAAARRARPDFAPDPAQLDRVCRLVEGMPLALELAAAWADTLPLDAIGDAVAASLDILTSEAADLPLRQRSVRAVFESTWQRLAAPEQALLAACAYFRGGFTREAAEAIAGGTQTLLARLVRHSLLTFDAAADRYAMHELLRQFAATKLAGNQEVHAAIGLKHSRYFCEWLGRQSKAVRVSRRPVRETPIAADVANAELAQQWALRHGQFGNLVAGIATWGELLMRLGRFRDGYAFFTRCAQLLPAISSDEASDPRLRYVWAVTLWFRADFVDLLGDDAPLRAWLRRSIELLEAEDVRSLSHGYELAQANLVLGDTYPGEDAMTYYGRGLAVARSTGDRWAEANALLQMSHPHLHGQNELDVAQRMAVQSYRIRQEIDDLPGLGWSTQSLALLALYAGDYAAADAYAAQSFQFRQRLGSINSLARIYYLRGWVELLRGDFGTAARYQAESLALWETLGFRHGKFDARFSLGLARLHHGRLRDAQEAAEQCRVAAATRNSRPGLAYGQLLEAMICLATEQPREAAALLKSVIDHLDNVRGYHLTALQALSFTVPAHLWSGDREGAEKALVRLEQGVANAIMPPIVHARLNAARATVLAASGEADAARAAWAAACSEPLVARSRWFEGVVGATLGS